MTKKKEFKFNLLAQNERARFGSLEINGGELNTPTFMPVGTKASVKALKSEDISQIGYRLILANAYHLFLRPGAKLIQELGGLHRFMNWPGLILTDSGGFQAFSLSQLNKLKAEGFEFRSHIDGTKFFLSPELSIEIQHQLGSDISMCLDLCLKQPSTKAENSRAVEVTANWAKKCLAAKRPGQHLFGIIQGGAFEDLRQHSAQGLTKLPFEGFAIGGVSVGEDIAQVHKTLEFSAGLLPENKPRYAMGIGDPISLIKGVGYGIDMFDCVLPSRVARNGLVFTSTGPLSIKRASFKNSSQALDPNCDCFVCQNYSKAYLRHLFMSKEILACSLNTWHNLAFLAQLFEQIRISIQQGNFSQFQHEFIASYQSSKKA